MTYLKVPHNSDNDYLIRPANYNQIEESYLIRPTNHTWLSRLDRINFNCIKVTLIIKKLFDLNVINLNNAE